MPKISETLNLAGGNLARPTRFSAFIAPPADIIADLPSRTFDVLCKSVRIPETIMKPIDMMIKGHTIKIPSRVNQEQTLEITFYLDENHSLRKVFSDWIAGLDPRFYAVTSPASINMINTKNIFGNILIKTRDFNETSAEPMNYLIENVYPISLGSINFNSSGVSEITELTVVFAYSRFIAGDESPKEADNFLDKIGISPNAFDGAIGTFNQFSTTLSGINIGSTLNLLV